MAIEAKEKEKYKQTHVQKLCVKRVCAIESLDSRPTSLLKFIHRILQENDVRKKTWHETNEMEEIYSLFIFCAEILDEKKSIRYDWEL